MGHYLSDFQDRPDYKYHEAHAANFASVRFSDNLWYCTVCSVVLFWKNSTESPVHLIAHSKLHEEENPWKKTSETS